MIQASPKVPVSIVVPNYNGEKYYASLKRILRPYYDKGFEIILVDDGSKQGDKTCELFENDFRDGKILRQENKGVAAARNYGAQNASGEFLQLLDIDDFISADKIEKQYNFAIERALDVVYSDWQMAIHNHGSTELEPPVISNHQPNILHSLINGWWQPPHSYLIKKTAYFAVNGSDETLTNAQDFDLVVRLALEGYKFGYLPGVFSIYNRYLSHESLARGSRKVYWECYDRCLETHFEIAEKKGLLDKNLKSAFANKWFHIARNAYKVDPSWGERIYKRSKSVNPFFEAEQESKYYRAIYKILGFKWAENFAGWKNRILG